MDVKQSSNLTTHGPGYASYTRLNLIEYSKLFLFFIKRKEKKKKSKRQRRRFEWQDLGVTIIVSIC
jgi:hypothetical protein